MKVRLSPLEWLISIAFCLVVYGGIMAGIWGLWCYVWSILWPEGPSMLIDPPYLAFVGTTILIVWLKSFLGVRK